MIKPTNYLLSQLTCYYGLGMGAFTFNWFNIAWTLGSPMIVPRWAVVNIAVGFIVATWIITPIVYFTDTWNTYNHPIAEVTHSSTRWSAVGIVSTAATFANLSAVLVHMFLHHSNTLWKELRVRSLEEKGNDVHCRLTALYSDVPDWWFAIVSIVAFIVIVIVGQVSHTILWYETFLSFIGPVLLVLPFGIVASITGLTVQNTSVYYLLVVIATALLAGNRSTTLAFVTIGYSTYCQTVQLVLNMKLGHYMRIAPRILFFVQLVACLVYPSFSIGIQYYCFVKGSITANHTSPLASGSFETTSVGAAVKDGINFFGLAQQTNRNLLWSLLLGALLPVPFWLARRRWKWCRLVYIPLMLTFISWMPMAAPGALFTWLLIGFLITFFSNKLYWKRHVYLTTGALFSGLYLSLLIIFGSLALYGVQFPS
jgi:OPT family oligopeptide transporter